MIVDSLLPAASKRADFDDWKFIIEEMKSFDKSLITNRITPKILKSRGVDLGHLDDLVVIEGGLYSFILEKFGFDITTSQVNKNEAYKLSTAVSHMQKLPTFESKRQRGMISKGILQLYYLKCIFFNIIFSHSRSRIRKCLLGLRTFDNAPCIDAIRYRKI